MSRDLAHALLRSGYDALPDERARHEGRPSFPVRLLGRSAVVVRGAAGARHFYDRSAVRRRGAVPAPLARLLFGAHAVHGLDGVAHVARKQMFLDILGEEATDSLADDVSRDLSARARTWPGGTISVFDELVASFGHSVQAWAGIEHPSDEASRDLALIVDGFGGAGRAYPRAWLARRRVNRWAGQLIDEVRAGNRPSTPGGAVDAIAATTELDTAVAAVELVNILRPTVAVAWMATFAVRALAEHPEWTSRLVDPGHVDDREALANEVRRTFPFVPALAARALRSADVDGVRVETGQRIILDVPGTNTDPRSWENPHRFAPERFLASPPTEFDFVPQGGGRAETGHRCPGEPLTVKLMASTLQVFAGLESTPAGDLAHDNHRIPTAPPDGLRLEVPTTCRQPGAH